MSALANAFDDSMTAPLSVSKRYTLWIPAGPNHSPQKAPLRWLRKLQDLSRGWKPRQRNAFGSYPGVQASTGCGARPDPHL